MTRNTAAGSRSPIKTRPLREPGESLRERLDKTLLEDVTMWIVSGALLIGLTVFEWFGYLTNSGRHPVLLTVMAVAGICLVCWRIHRVRSIVRPLILGLEGERAVGQFLNKLRSDGYNTIHDIEEDGWNIDHVMVGPTGVYAIETKTIGKPNGQDAQIIYDGETILIDGHTPDRDPLKQAEASARRIRDIVRERTGQTVEVRPVVLYPGWYVRRRCPSPHVWVVNEKYLPGWLDHEPEKLTEHEVQRYTSVLEDYQRGRN